MAILNGIISKMNGSAGNLTFRAFSGRTVVSEKITTVTNNRTDAQQRQRMKWVNIIRMYSGISPLLNKGFEKKQVGLSDYNVFVMLNTSVEPVYLTKREADNGACIAAPYQITRGILPSIEVSGEGAGSVTDIRLGSLTIDAETTVAEFSQAVVNNNRDYNYGEQISFFDILQDVNMLTGIPYCRFGATAVVLNRTSEVKLWDLVNSAGFASVAGESGNLLGHGEDEGDGVFAWVHSSYQAGATHVSTQYLINNNSILANYTSEEAFNAAAESYGGSTDVFLTPDTDSGGGYEGMYRLTVQSENTNMGIVSGGGLYAEGDNATFSAVPKSGYRFTGWYRNGQKFSDDAQVTEFEMPAADVTVVAHFDAIPPADLVTVTLTSNGNGTVKAGSATAGSSSSTQIEKGSSVVLTGIPASGYRFKQWSDGQTMATRTMTNVQADVTLSATFEESSTDMHTVTLTASGGGEVKIDDGEYDSTATKEIEDGGSCIIEAQHPYGGEFTRWSDNNTQNPRTLSNIQEDITLSAEFDS